MSLFCKQNFIYALIITLSPFHLFHLFYLDKTCKCMYNEHCSSAEVSVIISSSITKEAILEKCLELAAANGLESINIRTVAVACNISIGSIYNYFPCKAELIAATVRCMWQEILSDTNQNTAQMHFDEYVFCFFEKVKTGANKYPNFFGSHAANFNSDEKSEARIVMQKYFLHLTALFAKALNSDNCVKQSAFNSSLSQTDFISFVIANLLSCLSSQNQNCDVLIEIIRRIIY